jgi:hypothetical protein
MRPETELRIFPTIQSLCGACGCYSAGGSEAPAQPQPACDTGSYTYKKGVYAIRPPADGSEAPEQIVRRRFEV